MGGGVLVGATGVYGFTRLSSGRDSVFNIDADDEAILRIVGDGGGGTSGTIDTTRFDEPLDIEFTNQLDVGISDSVNRLN